jgi:hypothetical protein
MFRHVINVPNPATMGREWEMVDLVEQNKASDCRSDFGITILAGKIV